MKIPLPKNKGVLIRPSRAPFQKDNPPSPPPNQGLAIIGVAIAVVGMGTFMALKRPVSNFFKGWFSGSIESTNTIDDRVYENSKKYGLEEVEEESQGRRNTGNDQTNEGHDGDQSQHSNAKAMEDLNRARSKESNKDKVESLFDTTRNN